MMNTNKQNLLGSIGTLALMLGASTSAVAASVHTLQIIPSEVAEYGPLYVEGDNNSGEDGGVAEQIATASGMYNNELYIASVMQAPQENPVNDVYQTGYLSITKMTANGLDPVVFKQLDVQISNQVSHLANHMNVVTFHVPGHDDIFVVTYGNNADDGITDTFAIGYDHMGNIVVPRFKMTPGNNNNNEGGAAVAARDIEGETYMAFGYESNGNNNRTRVGVLHIDASTMTFENMFLKDGVTASNGCRDGCVTIRPDGTVLHISVAGNNRPSNYIKQTAYNLNGDKLFPTETLVTNTTKNGIDVMPGQQSTTAWNDDIVATLALFTTGNGKNTNNKINSTSAATLYFQKFTPNGYQLLAAIDGIDANSHTSLQKIEQFGADGKPALMIYSASPTGVGLGSVKFYRFNELTNTLENLTNKSFPLSSYTMDSGYLAQMYGPNPGTSGRDFIMSTTEVQNPGFNIEGAFEPGVKSFFVMGVTAQPLGALKPYAYAALIPGYTVGFEPTPEAPTEHGENIGPQDTTSDDPIVEDPTGGGPTGSGVGAGSGSSGSGNNPEDPDFNGTGSNGGCSVSAPNHDGSDLGMLALLGAAGFIGLARRRREEA